MDYRKAWDLVDQIQSTSRFHKYRMEHFKLASEYLCRLNDDMGWGVDETKLILIGVVHDIMKERLPQEDLYIDSHLIPWDLNDYVRRNLAVLEEFGMDEYFNSDVQLHPLAGAIFLRKEFYIDDPEIIYPVMFHSCPVMKIYEGLSQNVQRMVDMAMLADKLSSNWLRINMGMELFGTTEKKEAPIDLDLVVFGENGMEMNYTMGLYLARLLGNGKHPDPIAVETTEFYHKRLVEMNPCLDGIKLGGKREWPKRRNAVQRTK